MPQRRNKRSIQLESHKYCWQVAFLNPGMVVLRVWSQERNRKDFPLEIHIRFDDPWFNYGPILTCSPERLPLVFQLNPVTPKLVRKLIGTAQAAGWGPHHPPAPRLFTWTGTDLVVRPPE